MKLAGVVLGDTACTSLWCAANIPFVDPCSSGLVQTTKYRRKMGISSLQNPKKRSGKTLTRFRRTLNGVSSI